MSRGKALCPGSCGEIVQGVIEGKDFLITCPIALYTEVSVELIPHGSNYICPDGNQRQYYSNYSKSHQAAKRTLEHFGALNYDISISISSNIPRSIGLASSTADITATCLAVAKALHRDIPSEVVANIALSIEPSDGVMYSGAVIFDHLQGKWRQRLGPLPEMDIYIVDTGDPIDTMQFNARGKLSELNRQKEPQVREALQLAKIAFERQDPSLLGKAMLMSAKAHENIMPRPYLPEIITLAQKYRALGINIAHSGSCFGVFFEGGSQVPPMCWKSMDKELSRYNKGCRIIKTIPDNRGPRIIK